MDKEKIQQGLAGPIASVRPPFTREGGIDYDSLRRVVDFDIQAGAGALLLTAGDSLFAILSDRDIAELTRAVVDTAAGRAVVVACTSGWATSQALEFAAYCREIGADILQVFLPIRHPQDLNAQAVTEHHLAVARQMPVMVNSGVIQSTGAADGLAIARVLIERGDNILAMKADVTGGYDRTMTSLVTQHWTMLAGGSKSFHMELLPYGCQGYLSTFITFMPSVADAYWKAIKSGNMEMAIKIITKIDMPFFDYICGAPGGFDAILHGCTEIAGLTQRWRRSPFGSLNDKEMEELSDFITNIKGVEREIFNGSKQP